MTRLEQAIRWWKNHDEYPIPYRHYNVLLKAELVEAPDRDGYCHPTKKGKEVLEGK